jgi:hypothetical protein
MVRLMGGNALFGVVLGAAMVGLGLTQHLPLFALFGGYVGLVSLWRLVDEAGDRRRSGRF